MRGNSAAHRRMGTGRGGLDPVPSRQSSISRIAYWGMRTPPMQCDGSASAAEHSLRRADHITASLVALDGRKRNFLEAAILIASPVCGLRPIRAARLATTNVPSVVRTGSFLDVLVTVSKKASTTDFTSFRATPLFFWTAARRSRWFIVDPY